MKSARQGLMVIASAMILQGFVAPTGRSVTVADDPYAPLRLYDVKWNVLPSGDAKEVVQLENHCTKTGLFFVCEQMVNGKSGALVVFLPIAKTATGGEEYRTQALISDASPAGTGGS